MTGGLLDPILLAFVFAPVGVGAALLLAYSTMRARVSQRNGQPLDAPASALKWIVDAMPSDRAEWGAAMVAELAAVTGRRARWGFALGCARASLLPPRSEASTAAHERRPILGLLGVTLPLLGLPLLYFAAAVFDLMGGSPYTSSPWDRSYAATAVIRLLLAATVGCLVAGAPLGWAGRLRGEPMPGLAAWGTALSVGMCGYFVVVMSCLAGGD